VAAHEVAPLPSVRRDELPLRVEAYKPPRVIDTETFPAAPRQVEGTDIYIKREFRRAWETFGGQASFGLPLTEAYERAEDERVVQYFEGAVFVLDRDVRDDDEYQELGRFERLQAEVDIMPIGRQFADNTGREFPPPAGKVENADYIHETGHYLGGEFREFYRRASGEWRLGNPLSEEMTEEINGVPTRVQYFEGGRLEWDAENEVVRVGHLGSWRLALQCEIAPWDD
jgi:hypothetical protein